MSTGIPSAGLCGAGRQGAGTRRPTTTGGWTTRTKATMKMMRASVRGVSGPLTMTMTTMMVQRKLTELRRASWYLVFVALHRASWYLGIVALHFMVPCSLAFVALHASWYLGFVTLHGTLTLQWYRGFVTGTGRDLWLGVSLYLEFEFSHPFPFREAS